MYSSRLGDIIITIIMLLALCYRGNKYPLFPTLVRFILRLISIFITIVYACARFPVIKPTLPHSSCVSSYVRMHRVRLIQILRTLNGSEVATVCS